ncbi:MAG: M20/M25/M40 family metallo-hydrolase [Candidatus Promineifilaceae bacterium]
MTSSLIRAISHARNERDRFLAELQDFLEIPSISSDPLCDPDVAMAAAWVADRLKTLGATDVLVYKTGKHPIVYGEIKGASAGGQDKGLPTVLIYGHYDVQRPDPLEEWESEPFVPEIRGDELFARGAVDNKGPIVASIAAVESLIQAGSIPVNIKFMIEGEEEVGSPSLPGFLAKHETMLSSDISLNGDSGMAAVDTPTITYALRGSVETKLTIKGPSVDLHSGLFGGMVHNPIHALAELIAGMHDEQGCVTLPDFYQDVLAIDDDERADLAKIPRDEAFSLAITGVPALWGESAYTPVERTGARPTLDILMIQGGAQKSAIPATAQAIISMRLVPDQSPERAYEQLRSFVELNAPKSVTWEMSLFEGSRPSFVDRNTPWIAAMSKALESSWGTRPLYDRIGGSIPAVSMLRDQLGIDSVLIGVYRPGDNLHAPNEKLHLPTWERTIETIIRFFNNLEG